MFGCVARTLTISTAPLLETLSQGERERVMANPAEIFSFAPYGRTHPDDVHETELCMPYDAARARRTACMDVEAVGYLNLYLGAVGKGPARRTIRSRAHRLLAAATCGPNFRDLATLGVGKIEVSHRCGNAWCLNPRHLRVLRTSHNKIDLDRFRPAAPV